MAYGHYIIKIHTTYIISTLSINLLLMTIK